MKDNLFKYIDENFPNLHNEINIRYELGEPFKNGSEERINQVMTRVISIFEDLFDAEDDIYIYIQDWDIINDPMFGNTTPNYIYRLLANHVLEEKVLYKVDEDIDEMGNTVQITQEYNVRLLYERLGGIPYKEILKGMAHYEQGREPSISQAVYFINLEKDILFHMYDDRGCIVYSNSSDKLAYMYHKYNNWIVNYWRDSIDSIFNGK
ncbi:protein of unknown function [Propionispira arboris]|uniref:DUF3885 domain-containing protein n=1 Tax=Propionispira arboris TaxID=84035 RepID=A0A1H7CGB8_9FIRM|nr:DUF3885 domain-containing protein [Propionispira arboris]SEJ88833.1 protein of unknown function [Propionispira arboris]